MTVLSPLQTIDTGFRFPKPSDEDLPSLAALAYAASATECGACRNYHVLWPYLRALGACGSGPEHDWHDERAVLAGLAADRPNLRWLIAGSADAGLLALVRAGVLTNEHDPTGHSITVVDRCETPLTLCRAYAASVGMEVETARRELFGFVPEETFDIVFMHHVLMFFDADRRLELMRQVARWLSPEGRLVTAVIHVTAGTPPSAGVEALQAWRLRVMEQAIVSGELDLPEDATTFIARLRDRGTGRTAARREAPWSLHDYTTMFRQAGLSVIKTVDLPYSDEEIAAIGPPNNLRAVIVAAPAVS